ncbi:hypothetical protein M405DRAFT_277481 [Rhizopogon salebrosus TDB-379]|nr:hypothetical protein M405DRAFT_277481 [Rhizopogon salebrosus TDB-379]
MKRYRYSRVFVTSGPSSYHQDFQINQDERLIAFYNKYLSLEPLSADLPRHRHSTEHNASGSHISIDSGSLTISFQRTIRVPEAKLNNLPPGFGNFPLYNVAEFARVLPEDMVEKGGLFLPAFEREAMWLRFTSDKQFAIRIYVGGVNGITGEPMIPNMASLLKRQNGVEKKQDYIIVPEQPWLDGIATSSGKVKQFVAIPYGSGYSIEHQITGSETTGGMQFEVIPAYQTSVRFDDRDIYHTPRELGLSLGSEMTMIHLHEESDLYDDARGGAITFGLGGIFGTLFRGSTKRTPMMSIGAGGTIKQTIIEDRNDPRIWDVQRAKIFNVQVLSAARFEDITNMVAPPPPVDIKSYAAAGYPFFDIFNEALTSIHGSAAFKKVKTVFEMDQMLDAGSGTIYQPGANIPLQECQCQENMLDCVYVSQIYVPCGRS